jgi:type III secretion protein L
MVLDIRDAGQLSRPSPSRKVIKAADFWAFGKAEETIAEAVCRSEQIVSAAQAAFDAEKERGYREGTETARLEQSARMLEIISQSAEYFSRVEARMVELVLEAIRHVTAGFDDRERVTIAVRNALQAVRTQKQLAVRVHPAQVDALRARMDELLETYPAIEFVDVSGDARLAPDACVIDSEIGSVEASVSGQLEAMHQTFRNVFASTASAER